MDIRHPELSLYMLELLNPYSDCLQVAREYDEDSGEFYITLKAKFSQWMKDKQGTTLFVSDAVVSAWRMNSKDEANDLIRLLEAVRDQIWPDKTKDEAQ